METSATDSCVPGEEKDPREALPRVTQFSVTHHESTLRGLGQALSIRSYSIPDLALRDQGPHQSGEEKQTIPYTQLPAGSQCILPGGSALYRPCALHSEPLVPISRGLTGQSRGPSCTSLEGDALSQPPTKGPKRLSPQSYYLPRAGQDMPLFAKLVRAMVEEGPHGRRLPLQQEIFCLPAQNPNHGDLCPLPRRCVGIWMRTQGSHLSVRASTVARS